VVISPVFGFQRVLVLSDWVAVLGSGTATYARTVLLAEPVNGGSLRRPHRDYANLHHEPGQDLCALDRPCHETVHRYIASGKYQIRREATYMAIGGIRADVNSWKRRRRAAGHDRDFSRRVAKALSVLWT
jgi:hypothetical protein